MNCTQLPLNKIYRAHFFSPLTLPLSLPPPLSLSLVARRSIFLHGGPWPYTAAEGCRHCETVEELSGCINLITLYGGSVATGVNTIISKQPGGQQHATDALRPAGPVYRTLPLL